MGPLLDTPGPAPRCPLPAPHPAPGPTPCPRARRPAPAPLRPAPALPPRPTPMPLCPRPAPPCPFLGARGCAPAATPQGVQVQPTSSWPRYHLADAPPPWQAGRRSPRPSRAETQDPALMCAPHPSAGPFVPLAETSTRRAGAGGGTPPPSALARVHPVPVPASRRGPWAAPSPPPSARLPAGNYSFPLLEKHPHILSFPLFLGVHPRSPSVATFPV